MLVITGSLVGILVVAMYLPVFHLGDAIGGAGEARAHHGRRGSHLQAIKYPVLLFLNADKGRPFGQLFQTRRANIGAG